MQTELCTIEELAKRAGVSPWTIKQWKTRRVPNVEMLRACGQALGYQLRWTRQEQNGGRK